MKILSNFFAICLLLFSFSCKKNNFPGPLTVPEVYSFSDQANTKCTEKLKNENKEITLTGFVHKLNIDPANNCFDVFENMNATKGDRIQIIVTADEKAIFNKITMQVDKAGANEFISIKIKGKIIGKSLYTNGGCVMGTFITVSDLNNITF